MAIRLGLAGDTMLGRSVGDALLAGTDPRSLFSADVVEAAREADVFVLNLECCISDRGRPWAAPGKQFFFRAPPVAAEALRHLGVTCVTLANNHALDFGEEALEDTMSQLEAAGIAWVGAGPNQEAARRPVSLDVRGFRLLVAAFTDHPADFAATADRPGVAYADLAAGVPHWFAETVRQSETDAVLVTPHWGPNMSFDPVPRVRAAAHSLMNIGASVVAGHSAHVFHGVQRRVLYDLGDFIDDYATDAALRNDLGLLSLLDVDERGPVRLEAIPIRLEFCHTRLADRDEAAWIERRFRAACATFQTDIGVANGRLVVTWG